MSAVVIRPANCKTQRLLRASLVPQSRFRGLSVYNLERPLSVKIVKRLVVLPLSRSFAVTKSGTFTARLTLVVSHNAVTVTRKVCHCYGHVCGSLKGYSERH